MTTTDVPLTETQTPSAPPAVGKAVEVAGRRVLIERPSTLKGTRGLAIFEAITANVPEIVEEFGSFRTRYMVAGATTLSRAEAQIEFRPRPAIIDGELQYRDDGSLEMLPSALAHMTEADWAENDGRLQILGPPPDLPQAIAGVLPKVMDAGVDNVFKLLAVFLASNADLKAARVAGNVDEFIEQAANDLIDDSFLDEVPEMLVAVAEVIDENLRAKFEVIGDRLGEALRVIGLGGATESIPDYETPILDDEPEPSKPGSSTSSPESTDGATTTSSTPPSTSSSTSEGSSNSNTSTDESAKTSSEQSP